MCNILSFDTNKGFRYAIKNIANSDNMQRLHEQYALWREGEPGPYLRKQSEAETEQYVSYGTENSALPALLKDHSGVHLAQLEFGFIPNWRSDRPTDSPFKAVDRAKKALDIGRKTWNAASETMFDEEKRTWKDSAHDRRCVILLNGVYIFHEQDGVKYPFYIAPSDGDCMPLAGLWDKATIDGKEHLTCAILLQEANEAMNQINNWGEHPYGPHRMPILLSPTDFDQWLEPIHPGDFDRIEALEKIIQHPKPDALEYMTVAMDGEGVIPNTSLAQEPHTYKELNIDVKGLNNGA
ncbi:MAG: SOS response-associated peptidase family protein [Salibacteraceae bacterium]